MPLEKRTIDEIFKYVKRDLPDEDVWFLDRFDFIDDIILREYLAKEFYSARYMNKMMEALNLSEYELFAHVKFQIIQYASIYEAVICYLLWNRYNEHEAVKEIEYHSEYRKVGALSSKTKILYDNEPVILCKLKNNVKTTEYSIKFDDKVDAAVRIGFLDGNYADDIKNIYGLRNNVHIAKAAKEEFEYEIEQSKLAYRRMMPFIDRIKEFIGNED